MTTATLTSKGQITIPITVRTALGLDAGDRVEFVATARGSYEIIVKTQSVNRLKGIIQKPQKPVSLAQLNRAIARMGHH
jgi:antitoxin PrlF